MSCYFITEHAYRARVNKKRKENQMIEELLERIAVALGGINTNIGAVMQSMIESEPEGDEGYIPAKAIEIPVNAPAVVIPGPVCSSSGDTRESLLARCKGLSITVPKGTRTSTLQKWVTREEAKPDLPSPAAITPDDYTLAVVLEEKTPQYSRDDVRIALIALCKKNNNDTQLCRDILAKSKAASVSELDELKFGEVMMRIKDNGGE